MCAVGVRGTPQGPLNRRCSQKAYPATQPSNPHRAFPESHAQSQEYPERPAGSLLIFCTVPLASSCPTPAYMPPGLGSSLPPPTPSICASSECCKFSLWLRCNPVSCSFLPPPNPHPGLILTIEGVLIAEVCAEPQHRDCVPTLW